MDEWIAGSPEGLTFTARDLPPGLSLTASGNLHGTTYTAKMGYKPIVTATLPSGQSKSESFFIFVDGEGTGVSTSGGGGCNTGLPNVATMSMALLSALALRRRGRG